MTNTNTPQAEKTGTAPQDNAGLTEQKSPPQTASVRFMNKVVSEFSNGVGELALTDFQKRLAQNYFIAIDAALKLAEEKRQKKKNNRDPMPVAWENVNMPQLARSVVAKARIGLDPAQKNHVNMMPFKNNTLNAYDIVFIDGYRGLELTAKKYGLEVPDAVIVELVYANDQFKSHKKSLTNPIESFDFEIVDDFNRGEIKGGFYFHYFEHNPEKNKLVVMTLKDIMKRKPPYASTEFWGGKKEIWSNGKPTGEFEEIEGWFDKMCYKTVYRAAYSDITIDSQKIDSDYLQLKQIECSFTESAAIQEIEEQANGGYIDVHYTDIPEEDSAENKNPENNLQEDDLSDAPQNKEPDNHTTNSEPIPEVDHTTGEVIEDGQTSLLDNTTKAAAEKKNSARGNGRADPFVH